MQTFSPTTEQINLKIVNRDQLFSEYSYTDDNLNPELSNYLVNQAQHFPPTSRVAIKIYTTDTTLEPSEAAQCIHRHFHLEWEKNKKELHYLLRFALLMFLFGMFALVLKFLTQRFVDNFFLTEILNIAAWVFVWEAVDALFLERREIQKQFIIIRRLAYADVKIVTNQQLPFSL